MKKTVTYDIGNPGSGLGQAKKCGGVKSINEIPTFSILIIISPTKIFDVRSDNYISHKNI
jgi:hypothetical protein